MTNPSMPYEERRAIRSLLRSKYLTTERDRELRDRLDDLAERQTTTDAVEARGLVVIGDSGTGKTTALKNAFSQHPAFPDYGQPGCPLVTITVPSPCTLLELGRVGCTRLGYPIKGEKNQHRVWELFRHHLELAGVKYLHFDEIQNITVAANVIEADKIRDTLKTFLNDPKRRVCLILSGLPSVAHFLQFDRQESRRCSFLRFPPLQRRDGSLVHAYASSYATTAGIGIEPHEEAALGQRLLHASCYQLGLTLEFTIDAIDRALRAGDPTLTRRAYAAEFTARTGNTDAANPFLVQSFLDIDCAKVLQTDAYPAAPVISEKSTRGRKPKVRGDE